MPPFSRLLAIQRGLLSDIKRELRSSLGESTQTIDHYYRDYQKEFHSYEKISNKKELLEEMQKSQIVYSGDYHTFPQSQKIPLRLLREMIKRKKKIIIAIEMVMAEHQAALDRYVAGKISEKIFLEAIHYDRLWGFQWEHFRPIFEFAKFHKLQMIALNRKLSKHAASNGLEKRDEWAGKIIATLALNNKHHLIYVIFGDLHLARNHLPHEVDRLLKQARFEHQKLIIYQNNENIYWQLAKKGIEHKVDVVRLRPRVYCITNAAPWVKLQSYLHWVENIGYHDQIYHSIKSLCRFLGIPLRGMDTFDLYTGSDVSKLVFELNSARASKQHVAWHRKIIEKTKSYFVPVKNLIYLKTFSQNDAHEEASIYLHLQYSKAYIAPMSIEDFFFQNLMLRTIGYLGSKILNPKRMCQSKQDFQHVLHSRQLRIPVHHQRRAKIAVCVLTYMKREKKFLDGEKFNASLTQALKKNACLIYEVSKALGHCLGEKLYYALRDGKISRKETAELFGTAIAPHHAINRYLHWLKRLDSIRLYYRSRIHHL